MTNSYRSPLSRARGLGSAKGGSHHWLMQRLSAVALIPLVFWLVCFITQLAGTGLERAEAVALIQQPFHAIGLVLFLALGFYHGSLGIQVVLEDYVGGEAKKILCVWIAKIACLFGGVASVVAVLSIVLKG